MRKWEFGSGSWEVGIRNAEVGVGKWEFGMRKWECGFRPLRAVGSMLYEPEAIGACAPARSRKERLTSRAFGCLRVEVGGKENRFRLKAEN